MFFSSVTGLGLRRSWSTSSSGRRSSKSSGIVCNPAGTGYDDGFMSRSRW